MNSLNRLTWPAISVPSQAFPNLYGLGSTPVPALPIQWVAVRQRFQHFNESLSLTPRQYLDGTTKYAGVVNCLNRHYYDATSDTDHSFLIGSWGKQTLY